MLMALLMFAKWWKFTTKETLSYIINIYFKFSKKLDKVYNDFRDWIKKFSKKFDVGIVYVFNVKVIKITFELLLIRSNLFSLKFVISNFWQFFCCLHFFLNLRNFFHFFPNKNCQVRKIWNQKNMLVGGQRG
jgi:hypothetical protein